MCGGADNCYFVGPYDFATIYNVLPLWNATPAIDGTGQSIAILNESNINIQDVRDFRNMFGLPANDPQVILNGPDPGLVQGVESEADLDVEWSGAVAKGATIKLVVTAPTNATEGVDLSAVYAVENSVAPVLSESFGECELFLGTAGNAFQSGIRQQAAAQGITFINSAGDEGSARCDPTTGTPPQPATHGLAVSGLASSPYGVAVGGTDFLNFGTTYNVNSPSPYWSPSNDPQHSASALGYVPETTWNDSCTNNIFVFFHAGANPEASCNNSQYAGAVLTVTGGGGKSSCTNSDGVDPPSCSLGYPKPAWQSAPGVPQDGVRDIPDVSLFAGNGFMDSAYIICEADMLPFPQPCSLNSALNTFLGIGGTSASSPAFAGVMALVNQFTNSSGQGNANYVLYKIASSGTQTAQACGATSSPSPSCIFYDVANGVNAVPCAKGSPNCNVSNGADAYGVLSGYNAGAGYDLTTGLGSVNASNLLHNWIQPANSSSATLSLNNGEAVSITHGQSVNFDISVTPSSATGVVSLEGTPAGAGSVSMASFPLQNGAASGTTAALAGGTSYSVKAHYSGDGTYKPSDSNAVTVTVAPEVSKTLISIPVFNATTGAETGNTPTTLVYGTPAALRVDVGNANAKVTFPEQPVCAPFTCATGTVMVTDAISGAAPAPFGGSGLFPLDSGGFAIEYVLIPGGTHQLSATYPGDNSFDPSSSTYTLLVTPASTTIGSPNLGGSITAGTQIFFSSEMVTSAVSGATPTGTVTFFDGANALPGPVTLTGRAGSAGAFSNLTGSSSATFTTSGAHQITANYSGDTNYAASTSAPASITIYYPTTARLSASSVLVNLGQSVTLTATVTSTYRNPPMTGVFRFTGDATIPGQVTPTLSTDGNGNQVLTATVTFTPQTFEGIGLTYSGDSNYNQSPAYVSIDVIVPDFSIAATTPSLNVTAGQSGMAALTVTPLSNASSSVALSCSLTAISGVACTFNPGFSLPLANGAPTTATVTISTQPPSSTMTAQFLLPRLPRSRVLPPAAQWLLVVSDLLVVLILYTFSLDRQSRIAARLGTLSLVGLLLSCGGGSASVGGSGGGGGSSPPSLTLTTSAVKVPYQATFTLTATVNSGSSACATVLFIDSAANGFPGFFVPVTNGIASVALNNESVGTHIISAQCGMNPSQSALKTNGSLNVVVPGSAPVTVQGTTSYVTHTTPIKITIQ